MSSSIATIEILKLWKANACEIHGIDIHMLLAYQCLSERTDNNKLLQLGAITML